MADIYPFCAMVIHYITTINKTWLFSNFLTNFCSYFLWVKRSCYIKKIWSTFNIYNILSVFSESAKALSVIRASLTTFNTSIFMVCTERLQPHTGVTFCQTLFVAAALYVIQEYISNSFTIISRRSSSSSEKTKLSTNNPSVIISPPEMYISVPLSLLLNPFDLIILSDIRSSAYFHILLDHTSCLSVE